MLCCEVVRCVVFCIRSKRRRRGRFLPSFLPWSSLLKTRTPHLGCGEKRLFPRWGETKNKSGWGNQNYSTGSTPHEEDYMCLVDDVGHEDEHGYGKHYIIGMMTAIVFRVS